MTQIRHSLVIPLMLTCLWTTTLHSQPHPVRRSVPCERGDRWRTEITSTKVSSGTVSVPGKEQRLSEKETTHLSAVITIDQVDKDGYASVWIAKIVRFVGPADGSASKVLLRPGSVIVFDRIGEYSVSLENGASLDEPASRIAELLKLPSRSGDASFEPPTEMSAGDEWTANINSMRAEILASGPPQLREYPEVLSLTGAGKVLGTKQHREELCLDLSFSAGIAMTEELEYPNQYIKKADQETEERILIPADYSTDFLDKRTTLKEVLVTESKEAGPSLDVTQVTTTTEQRTYLEFKGGGVRPWRAPEMDGSLTDGLLFGLDFDEASTQGSGNETRQDLHGTFQSSLQAKSISSGHVAGQIQHAVMFDGNDDHVQIMGAVDLLRQNTAGITVACWIKTPPKKLQFVFDVGFYGDTSLTLLIQEKNAKFHLSPKAGGVGLSFPLDAAEWTHVAVTWDGSTQRAYVNGKGVHEVATARRGVLDDSSIGDNPFLIGSQAKQPSRQQRYFAGEMDEFALWTRSLDASEIAIVYGIGNQGESIFDK